MATETRACKFFAQGKCRYGINCRFRHVESDVDGSNQARGGHAARNDPWKRKWKQFFGEGKTEASEAYEFSVMTLNMLAQSLVDPRLYARSAFPFLSWEFRRKRTVEHLLQHQCDVFLFQEFEATWFSPQGKLKAELEGLGYAGKFQKRTGEKQDGCAVFYKKQVFELVEEKNLLFRDHPDPLMDRDNIALILVLRHKDSKQAVCLAATHLLFNPKRGDVKLLQLKYLLEQLQTIQEMHNCSTVLCGDFNFTPDSALYHYLFNGSLGRSGLDRRNLSGQARLIKGVTKGGKAAVKFLRQGHSGSGSFIGKYTPPVETDGTTTNSSQAQVTSRKKGPTIPFAIPSRLCELKHSLGLASAYATGNTSANHTGEPAITQFHPSFAGTVDYICYDIARLKVAEILELPRPEAYWKSTLPCSKWGSDHLSLACKFLIVSEKGADS